MRSFLAVISVFISLNLFSQIEILNGDQIYVCGNDEIYLKALTGPDIVIEGWNNNPLIPVKIPGDSILVKNIATEAYPVRAGKYYLYGTFKGVAMDTFIDIGYVYEKPPIELNISDTAFCGSLESVTVQDVSSSTAGYTYEWSTGLTGTNTLTVDSVGTYILKKMDFPIADCFSQDTFTYRLNAGPELETVDVTSACGENTFTLEAHVTVSTGTTEITWKPSTGLSSTNGGTVTLSYDGTYDLDQVYYAEVINTDNGCVGNTDSIRVIAAPIPESVMSIDVDSIMYCDQDSVLVSVVNYASSDYLYYWKDGNGVILDSNIQNYWVKSDIGISLTASGIFSGCTNSSSTTSFYFDDSPSDLVATAVDSVLNNEVVEVQLSGNYLADQLSWTHSGNSSLINEVDSTLINYDSEQNDEGFVTFIARAENDCGFDTSSVKVYFIQTKEQLDYIVYVPNSFQPNNDNADVANFRVYGENISDSKFDFKVYDKWGQIIFESSDFEEMHSSGWNGEGAIGDVYNYTLEAEFSNGEPIEKVGSVVLVR